MAKAFNLTAQLNLQGPVGIKPIVSKIKKEIGAIKADLQLNIDPSASKKVATITAGIQNLSKAALTASASVGTLNASLTSLGSSLGNIKGVSGAVNAGINGVTRSSQSSAKAAKQAATEIQAFGDAAGLALKRFAAFTSVSTVIYGLVNSINDAISEFIVYDRELVRLSQVTGGTIDQFGRLSIGVQNISNEVRRLSTSLGVSSQDLIKVASTLAQAGLSADETKVALEALAKSALAPSFDDIIQTTEGSIAAIRQFGLGIGELESALGSINQVAADFAVESDDIIKAIQRTGGVFASASRGVSSGTDALNEFIAVFTSIRATTRESAETIATGLRTILTRIQRSTTIDALKELGVELRDSEGKFIGAYKAVETLSEGLSGLDPRSGTFAEIVEELGGFRQIGKVIPLIQQFGTAQNALNSAQKGSTSLTEASVKALFSLENQLNRTREEFLALISEFAQSTTIKTLTGFTLGLTRGLIGVAGALKPLLPLITTLATIKLAQKLPEFIGGGGQTGFLTGLFKGAAATNQPASGIAAIAGAGATARPTVSSPTLLDNTTALKNLTTSINNLSQIIQSRPGRTGFATGGLVGGVGNRDTVPAMLTPGEFVIRKKAVESIGANNLDNINKYGLGGKVTEKGSDLIQLYPSLSNKIDPESEYSANVIPKIITSKNTALISNMIKNKKQNMALETWRNFELALSQAYRLFYDTSSGAYLDFPKKPGDAKFLKEGERNRTNDLRGNNNETMLAKLIGSGLYKMNSANNVSAYYPENPKQIDGIISSYVGGKNKERTQYGRFKFAGGGSIKDTVPALLTPGEFVIRKEAAQKLGSATLNKMNYADKLQGYNKGGFVGGLAVQRFADGDFVPQPLTRKGPGDIEAYIQKIIISLEKAVKAAEKQTYKIARESGATAIEAVKLARQAGIDAAKKETSRITSAVTERGGATQYIEKDKIRAAEKRVLASLVTGKDPSVKGATERRRTPGFLERDQPATPTIEAETKAVESAKETSESLEKVSDSASNFDQKLTNVMLVLSNIALPQIKSFADSLKITENALGRAAIQAVETGASLALSTSLGLQAVGASKATTQKATLAAGAFGALGGGLQAFGSKTIENAIKENSKALSSFDKAVQQTIEAPTAQLQVEAASQLEKEFTKLAESTANTTSIISDYEWYENLGSVITESTSTYLALTTSLLAFQQATNQATTATIAKTVADKASTTSAVVSGAANTAGGFGGFFAFIGKTGTLLAKFNFYLQATIAILTVGTAIYNLFTKTTGRTVEQLDRFGKSLEDVVKNGNNYSLANQRFTGQVLENYRRIKSTLPDLTVAEQKQIKQDVFGGTQSVDITGKPTQQTRSSGINQFNLLFDQFARTKLALKGLNVGAEQSINDFLQTLDTGSQSYRTFNQVITELTSKTANAASEFEKLTFVRALTQPVDPSIQAVSKEEAETKLARATIEEIKTVSKNYNAIFNENIIAAREVTDSFRRLQVSSLNFSDILNRINSSLKRLNTDTSNAFDDALYSLQLFSGEAINIRADQTAARQAEVLRNPAAFDTAELIRAIDTAVMPFQMDDRTVTLASGETKPLSEYAKQLRGNILALQAAEQQVPLALRNFIEQRQAGEKTDTAGLEKLLRGIIEPIELDKDAKTSIVREITAKTEKSLGGEGTKSLEEIVSEFPGMIKSMDSFKGSLETATLSLETQAESAKRVAELSNAMAAQMQRGIALQIKASELRLNTELEIAQITGKRSGIRELNAPFDATINKLTESIGGTLNPAEIGTAISSKITELRNAIAKGVSADEQAKLASNINSLNQALSMLGDKNLRLINALDNLRKVEEERKGLGSIFEQLIKASTDPIARMDLERTMQAADRVRAGGTDITDIQLVLEKYIPMLSQAGGRFADSAEDLRQSIQTRVAAQGGLEALGAGDIKTFLGSLGLVNIFGGGRTQSAQQTARDELTVSLSAIEQQRLLIEDGLKNVTADTNDTMSEFRDRFANIWPSIINEMEMFKAELNRLNAIQNSTDMAKPVSDLSEIDTMLNKSLKGIAQAASFENRTLTTTGLPASMFSGRKTQPQLLTPDFIDRYYNTERSSSGTLIGDPNTLQPKKLVDMQTLNIDDISIALQKAADITKKSNPKLSERLTIQLETMVEEREKFIKLLQSRQKEDGYVPVPSVSRQQLLSTPRPIPQATQNQPAISPQPPSRTPMLPGQTQQQLIGTPAAPPPQSTTKTAALSPFRSNISVGTDTLTVRQPIRQSLGPSAETTARQLAEAAALRELAKGSGGTYDSGTGLKPQQPPTVITDENGRKFLEAVYAIPDAIKSATQPIGQPTVGGGQFSIPPETVRPTAATIPTKLDFDYNDFITKFNRAFDSQTGKFREAIGGLSLAFQALNPPIDKFSSSVTRLIDGLNNINDAGGIKGPNIPEKVTVEVVFNEDLTIDTSRINNNDLLTQIGVITTRAVNERIAELKLTGK